jgi:radical SAM family uncharacterized protein
VSPEQQLMRQARVGAEETWVALERLLPAVERPSRYIDSEWGARRGASADYRVALVYPDTYEIGQANQAIGILYEILNGLEGVVAERAYVPWVDMSRAMREGGKVLSTLETTTPLGSCDLIGITLPYELTYTNVLEVLDLAGLPLRARDRDGHTLVLGGGPCAYNPVPMSPFFDAILIGEGEEAVVEIVSAHRAQIAAGADKRAILEVLAHVDGVYVPAVHAPDAALTSLAAPVMKRVVRDLSSQRSVTCPIVPFAEVVHDRLTIEVLRGCTRGCRFCQAGMIYRPVRERSADEVVRDAIAGLACTGYDEVSLTSLSSTDHSRISEILQRLTRRLEGRGVTVSLPSLRVDAFSVEMASLVSRGKKSGLTFAPEAGTQRLRDVINKNVTEEDLLSTIGRAFGSGFRRVKLYFMIGLPTETDEDIRAIGSLVRRVLETARERVRGTERGSVRISVSVSTFVPKAHTPFQWEPQAPLAEILRKQEVLRSAIPRKGVELSWHDAEVSFLEGVLARGDRTVADAIEAAWRRGARFDAWTEHFDLQLWRDAFAEAGVDAASYAQRERSREELLPWDVVSCGVSAAYLWGERQKALAGEITPDCSFEGCTGCDACADLGAELVLSGVRHG